LLLDASVQEFLDLCRIGSLGLTADYMNTD
jgi:hypothetical protein